MEENNKDINKQKKGNYFADDSFYSEISGTTTTYSHRRQKSNRTISQEHKPQRKEKSVSIASQKNKSDNSSHKKERVSLNKISSIIKSTDSSDKKRIFSTDKVFSKNKNINSTTEKKEKLTGKLPKKIKNVDALDGLRALAIISVIFYHLSYKWAQGGLLGVTVFFVLSGYLITGIISSEIKCTGTIDLKRFWIRRVRRLFPAIVVVVFGVMLLCILFNQVLLTKMKPDVIPSLFWFQNWWYIIRDLSYFENLGAPSPLIHFWSLAIEEQFYIFWPLILLGLSRLNAGSKVVRRVCLLLAAVSVLLMLLMYNPDTDPTRVYYGTDTRAFSLLLGAWLSFVFPLGRQAAKIAAAQTAKTAQQASKHDVKQDTKHVEKTTTTHASKHAATFAAKFEILKNQRMIANIVGVISLVVLLLFMIFIDGTSEAMFRGILLLASICTLGLIFSAATPNTIIAKIFSCKPLVWIGKRSYGMYLWHFPLILLLSSAFDCPTTAPWFALLILALTFLISAVQYKFIEDPIRRGALGQRFNTMKSEISSNTKEPFYKRLSAQSKKVLVTGLLAVVSIVSISVAAINTTDVYLIPMEEIQSTGNKVNEAMYVEGQYYPVLVGDSVTGNLNINQVYPQGLNDSVVNRWLSQAIDVVKSYQSQGVISNVLIVSCFSNHEIRPGELETLYGIMRPDQELFLVTPFTPYPSAAANTEQIKNFAAQHNNVHVIDWAQIAAPNKEAYLYKDGTHLKPEGQTAYLNMLIGAINDYLPENVKYKTPENEIHVEASGAVSDSDS